MTEALFDAPKNERARTTRALVPVTLDYCPSCGGRLDRGLVAEQALFRHGGYGADRTTTTLACSSCTWTLVIDVTETRPEAA